MVMDVAAESCPWRGVGGLAAGDVALGLEALRLLCGNCTWTMVLVRQAGP